MEAQSSQLAEQTGQLTDPEPSRSGQLRVLLDARKLGDGGIGVYIDNTVRGLLERDDVQLNLIAQQQRSEAVPWKDEVTWLYDDTRPYSLSEYLCLARRIDFEDYDLFHAPHYTLPFGISIPSVVTIHDLIHIEHPERVYYPLVARTLMRSAVRRASAVLAVSEDTKRALAQQIGIEGVCLEVIPNAIPASMAETCVRTAAGDDVARLIAGGSYFVAVISNLKPHKGVERLLRAYAELRVAVGAATTGVVCPRLLLVGHGAEALMKNGGALLRDAGLEGVTVVGAVTPEVLRELYRFADAVVVASRAEGFCFPALEAQSVGTRVVCTPVPAILEFLTERDLVARDFSSEALAAAMYQAAVAPQSDRSIYTKHLERFSRERVSGQLCELYRRVVANSQGVRRAVV